MRSCTRALSALLLGVAPLFVATPSTADDVGGTRFDVIERGHAVEVKLERGHATRRASGSGSKVSSSKRRRPRVDTRT
jgi:hypothetical protein